MKLHRPSDVRKKLVVGDYVTHKEWRVGPTPVLQVKSAPIDPDYYGEDFGPQYPIYLIKTSHNNYAWCRREMLTRVYWDDTGEDDSVLIIVEPQERK